MCCVRIKTFKKVCSWRIGGQKETPTSTNTVCVNQWHAYRGLCQHNNYYFYIFMPWELGTIT